MVKAKPRAKPKPITLADELKSVPVPLNRQREWLVKMPAAKRESLLQLARDKRADKVKHSTAFLYEWLRGKGYDIPITVGQFRDWFREAGK